MPTRRRIRTDGREHSNGTNAGLAGDRLATTAAGADVVATTRDSEEFGRLVGAEAKARNFEAAGRRAFVADGQAYNWAIQKLWFADDTPVTDFIHVLGYVWLAASATGTSEAERWDRYSQGDPPSRSRGEPGEGAAVD